jgi:hypothetical protein
MLGWYSRFPEKTTTFSSCLGGMGVMGMEFGYTSTLEAGEILRSARASSSEAASK